MKKVKPETEAQGAETKEERNPSATFTIKSLAGNIKKLEKLKMCTDEEIRILKEIHKATLTRWISIGLEL